MVDLKKILLKLIQCNHVTDYGTSGAWTYRKWSDGTAEAWAEFNPGTVAGSLWASPIYYYDAPAQSFPSGLFSSTPHVHVTAQTSQWPGATVYSTSTTQFRVRFTKPVSSAQALTYSVYAIA